MNAPAAARPHHLHRPPPHCVPGTRPSNEVMLREMLAKMREHKGFLGGDLIPPEAAGEEYQLVIRFASEAELQGLGHERGTTRTARAHEGGGRGRA